MPATCAYNGCTKPALTDRMFCSDHVHGHGVSSVASLRTYTRDSAVVKESEKREQRDTDKQDKE